MLTIATKEFKRALRHLEPIVDPRSVLVWQMCVLLRANAEGISLTATDGIRCGVVTLSSKPHKLQEFVLPYRYLAKLLPRLGKTACLEVKNGGTVITSGSFASKIDVFPNFPDLSPVLVHKPDCLVSLNLKELLGAIKRGAVPAIRRHKFLWNCKHVAEFSLEGGKLTIESDCGKRKTVETLRAQGSGSFSCRLNLEYLIDLLARVKDETVSVGFGRVIEVHTDSGLRFILASFTPKVAEANPKPEDGWQPPRRD